MGCTERTSVDQGNSHFTRKKTRQRAHFILKPWKRIGLEDFSRTKGKGAKRVTRDPRLQRYA